MIVLDKNGEKLNLMPLNVGPSHPATHGCLRFMAAMDGETIVASVEEIGYLHRGFEKMVERGTWQQVIPYTDRLNYCSAIMNNIAFCRAVEKMFGVEITERAKVLRVIVNELSRINDHFVCVAAAFQDLGGTTPFMYAFNPREEIMCIWEKLTGARLTNSYARIGGLYRDSYEGFEADVLAALDSTEKALKDLHACLDRNRIFLDRTVGIGKIRLRDLRLGSRGRHPGRLQRPSPGAPRRNRGIREDRAPGPVAPYARAGRHRRPTHPRAGAQARLPGYGRPYRSLQERVRRRPRPRGRILLRERVRERRTRLHDCF